jgi:hypothetical protein
MAGTKNNASGTNNVATIAVTAEFPGGIIIDTAGSG